MEFTLGTEVATTATLNVYCDQAFPAISGYIYAKEWGFDETTATYNNTIGTSVRMAIRPMDSSGPKTGGWTSVT